MATIPKRRRQSKKGAWFLVIGLALSGGALLLGARVYMFGASTVGRVVSVSHSRGSSRTCSPVIAYEIGGIERQWQSTLWSAPCEFREGESVDLYYWPHAPDSPYLPSYTRLLLFPGIPTGLGLIFLLLSVRAFVGRPPSKKQILRAATKATVADAPDGAVVAIEGIVSSEGTSGKAPITGRPCLAYHVRVLVPIEGLDGEGVPRVIGTWAAPLTIRDHTGAVQLRADTKVSVYVDADAKGTTDGGEPQTALEAYLARRGVPDAQRDTLTNTYTWNEAIIEEGARVLIYGVVMREAAPPGSAYRQGEGRVVMTPGPDGTVTLALAEQLNRSE